MNMFSKVFGTRSQREVKRIMPLVEKIESLRPDMQKLSDEELRGKTREFKKRPDFTIRIWLHPVSDRTHFPMPVLSSSGFQPVVFFLIWRPPALPHRLQCSTIGRLGLNRRVRDGNGCVPQPHRHQKCFSLIAKQ